MQRLRMTPRANWQATVESQGFHFHTLDGEPYWDESACYVFRKDEIEQLEKATYALNDMCLQAVDYVLAENQFEWFHIPEEYHDWLKQSWNDDEHTAVGRFDLAFPPGGAPRLLEYNADTPTALLEAAVIQWFWLQDTRAGVDQFNSIHERLIEFWKMLAAAWEGPAYFTSLRDHVEDYMTVNYLRETALQGGWQTEYLAMDEIRWNPGRGQFVDRQERTIPTIFKLYPWEWMLREEFGPHLRASKTHWLEAPWKMLLSNKAILPVLWRLFPTSPYLLRAEYEPFGDTFVQKPILGREGANVTLVRDLQSVATTEGPYDGPWIYQDYCPLPQFDGNHAVIGSWLVNGHACGIGIREDSQPITQNTSRFVPHCIE